MRGRFKSLARPLSASSLVGQFQQDVCVAGHPVSVFIFERAPTREIVTREFGTHVSDPEWQQIVAKVNFEEAHRILGSHPLGPGPSRGAAMHEATDPVRVTPFGRTGDDDRPLRLAPPFRSAELNALHVVITHLVTSVGASGVVDISATGGTLALVGGVGRVIAPAGSEPVVTDVVGADVAVGFEAAQ